MGSLNDPRIKWNEREWFDVMHLAIPLRDRTGKSWEYCISTVQKKALPKLRQRPIHSNINTLAREYEARVRAGWIPEGRQSEPDKPSAERKPEGTKKDQDAALEATFGKTQIYWTQREWAMMACAVKYRLEAGDTRGLPRLFFETQVDVLPLGRCRRKGGFASLPSLQAAFDAAIPNIWTLPPDVRAKCEGRGAEYEAQQAKAKAGHVQAPAPVEPVAEVIPETIPSAAPASYFAASVPVMMPPIEGDPLATRIAGAIATAAATIAAETRAQVMAEYDRQLDRLTAALHATLREYVHTLVTAELGPLSTPPTPSATPSAPPVPDTPPPVPVAPTPSASSEAAPRLRVDIVGMERIGTATVSAAAQKLGLDVRLIDSDKVKTGWEPRPTVILATRFVPHAATRMAKKAGVNMLFANAGPESVVGIMESLAEHRGALQ